MTLNQITYDILLLIRGGKLSDDENINLRQIEYWIVNTRSLIIAREIDKKKDITENIIQNLGCVDVDYVDSAPCCDLKSGCNIIRTNIKIPTPIETAHRLLITRVAGVDITSVPFQFISYQRAPYAGSGRYNKNHVFAFFHDNYIYVVGGESVKMVRKINIQGVFQDPREVKSFNTCAGIPCYTNDSEFPISTKHLEILKEMVLKTNMRIAVQSPTDISGDGKHNLEPSIERK